VVGFVDQGVPRLGPKGNKGRLEKSELAGGRSFSNYLGLKFTQKMFGNPLIMSMGVNTIVRGSKIWEGPGEPF